MNRQRVRTPGVAVGKRFVIVASQFHPELSRALVRGATSVLRRAGVPASRIRLLWAPGAFELPILCARAARRRPRPDAVIALGAIVRGQTPQYEVLAHAVAQGLMLLSIREDLPVTFGVIVSTTLAQARARAGLPASGRQARVALSNRGEEAAWAALEVSRRFGR